MLQLITINVEIIKDLVNKVPIIHYNVWYQCHLDGFAVLVRSPIVELTVYCGVYLWEQAFEIRKYS